jgi:hypothetical protein
VIKTKLHSSQFDKIWIIKNLYLINDAVKEDNKKRAVDLIDCIISHLEKTKDIINNQA